MQKSDNGTDTTEMDLAKRKRKKSILTLVPKDSDKAGSSSLSDENSGEDVSEDEWKFSTKKTRTTFPKRLTKQTLKSKLAEKTRNLRMISKLNNSGDKSSAAVAAAATTTVKCETPPLISTRRPSLNVKPKSELFDLAVEKEENVTEEKSKNKETSVAIAVITSDISVNAFENNACSLKKEKDVAATENTVSISGCIGDLSLKKERIKKENEVIKEEEVSTCKEPIVINYSMIATADQQQTLDVATAIPSSSAQQCIVVPVAKQQQQQSFISDSAKSMVVSPFSQQTCSSQNSAVSSPIPVSSGVFQTIPPTSVVSNKPQPTPTPPPSVPVSSSCTVAAAAAVTFVSPFRSGNVTPSKTSPQQQNAYVSSSTSGQMSRIGYTYSPTTRPIVFSNKVSSANRVTSRSSSFVRTPSPRNSVFTASTAAAGATPSNCRPSPRRLFSPAVRDAVSTGKLQHGAVSSSMKSKLFTPSNASSLPTSSRILSGGVTSSSSSSSSQRKKAGTFLNKIGNISPNGTVIHTDTGSVTITPRKLPPERPPVQRKLFKNEIEGSISCRSENGMLRYVVNLANGTHIPLSTVQVQKLREQNNGTLPVKLKIPVPSDVADKIEPSFVIED